MLSQLHKGPLARGLGTLLIALFLAPGLASAQTNQGGGATQGGATTFTAQELEQVAAPIALYPDPLVAQILMASTYPLEVVQAARFAKANAGLKGAQLDDALKKEAWDDSVKSLVSFPQVLTMMNEKLDWTQNLGDAFLGQQKDLMDTIQVLRAKADAAGNLKSNAEQTVTTAPAPAVQQPAPQTPAPQTVIVQAPPQIITIQPANPQVIYVPTYNPTVIYGPWPYPAYPPYAYYPPGYVAGAALLSFGIGMAVGGAVWGNCNWGRGDVDVNVNQYNNYTRNVNNTNVANTRIADQGNRGSGQWQHNPEHRKGAQYRDASTQQRFNKAATPNAQSREAFRGRAAEGRQEMARGGMQQGSFGGRQGSQAPTAGRAQTQQLGGATPGQARAPGAFEGVGQGRNVSTDSARGQASRESLGASSAGRGGNVQAGGAQRSRPTGGSVQSGGGQRGGAPAGGGSRGGGGGGGGGGRGRR